MTDKKAEAIKRQIAIKTKKLGAILNKAAVMAKDINDMARNLDYEDRLNTGILGFSLTEDNKTEVFLKKNFPFRKETFTNVDNKTFPKYTQYSFDVNNTRYFYLDEKDGAKNDHETI